MIEITLAGEWWKFILPGLALVLGFLVLGFWCLGFIPGILVRFTSYLGMFFERWNNKKIREYYGEESEER